MNTGPLIGLLISFMLGCGGSFAGYWLSDRMIKRRRRALLAEARRKLTFHVTQNFTYGEIIALLEAGDMDGKMSITYHCQSSPEVKVAGKVH